MSQLHFLSEELWSGLAEESQLNQKPNPGAPLKSVTVARVCKGGEISPLGSTPRIRLSPPPTPSAAKPSWKQSNRFASVSHQGYGYVLE